MRHSWGQEEGKLKQTQTHEQTTQQKNKLHKQQQATTKTLMCLLFCVLLGLLFSL